MVMKVIRGLRTTRKLAKPLRILDKALDAAHDLRYADSELHAPRPRVHVDPPPSTAVRPTAPAPHVEVPTPHVDVPATTVAHPPTVVPHAPGPHVDAPTPVSPPPVPRATVRAREQASRLHEQALEENMRKARKKLAGPNPPKLSAEDRAFIDESKPKGSERLRRRRSRQGHQHGYNRRSQGDGARRDHRTAPRPHRPLDSLRRRRHDWLDQARR